jgi:Arc/MetJ family transcription regulator
MEEYMVHRVMQRVDVVLDQRLREAIALVVQEQTRSLLPRLREEVESVVRHAVYEAVADELAGGNSSAPLR